MALFKYPGKKTWWYEFHFAGQKVRESAKTRSKEMARRAENARRRELEESYHGLKKRAAPRLFSVAADEWLTLKKPSLADRSHEIERANLRHLLPTFGKQLISDVDGKDISRYQQDRVESGASPKTVNLEIGTLRAILRRNRLWAEIQPDVRMLPTRDDIGRAITPEEEQALLVACGESRSRSLLPAVTLALNTCMRYSEIRLLRWSQVDFAGRTLTVGKSKTDSGSGRVIPLNTRAAAVLDFWASNFPDRQPAHYMFPSERYGAAGDAFKSFLRLQHRPDEADWPLEGSVGSRQDASRRAVSVPRSSAYRLHPHAGGGCTFPADRPDHGLEHGDDDPNGEALWSHWARRFAKRGGEHLLIGKAKRGWVGGAKPSGVLCQSL